MFLRELPWKVLAVSQSPKDKSQNYPNSPLVVGFILLDLQEFIKFRKFVRLRVSCG
jgi:hypothetical protein